MAAAGVRRSARNPRFPLLRNVLQNRGVSTSFCPIVIGSINHFLLQVALNYLPSRTRDF